MVEESSSLNLIATALDFAAKKHRDQRRKDHAASPYINHPILLFKILAVEAKVTDEIVLASALLHDTVEDTDTTFEEIERHFGSVIASIVKEVTDDMSLPRLKRKEQQVQHAPNLSQEAALVKYADKIANLRDLMCAPPLHWSLERKIQYCDWSVQVIQNISPSHPQLSALFEATVKDFKQKYPPSTRE